MKSELEGQRPCPILEGKLLESRNVLGKKLLRVFVSLECQYHVQEYGSQEVAYQYSNSPANMMEECGNPVQYKNLHGWKELWQGQMSVATATS